MSKSSIIRAQNLCVGYSLTQLIFDQQTFSIPKGFTGITGQNGSGKTTLIKTLAGEKKPVSGSLERSGTVGYLAQTDHRYDLLSVGDFFGVQNILESIKKVENGLGTPEDFDQIGQNWEPEKEARATLDMLGFVNLDLHQSIKHLSGGEKRSLAIGRLLFEKPDILLLDEPGNDLDQDNKRCLIHSLRQFKGSVIMISHDRDLLSHTDQIIETMQGQIRLYPGNWDHYRMVRDLEAESVDRKLDFELQKKRQQLKSHQQKTEERKKKESHGKKKSERRGWDKITRNSKIGKAQKSEARLSVLLNKQKEELRDGINDLRESQKKRLRPDFNIKGQKRSESKILVDVKEVNHSFDGHKRLYPVPVNLVLRGSQKVAIKGANGSGKSSLIHMITGDLTPEFGEIYKGFKKLCFIDQQLSLLNSELTLLENFRAVNPDLPLSECHFRLSQHLLKDEMTGKQISELSGGELLRAHLACFISGETEIDLLILDEPTNHLDLESIEALEKSLNLFEGAMLIISHDKFFLEAIQIDHVLEL